MLRIRFRAMGSNIEAMTASDSKPAQELLAVVPEWFEEWESILSRFRPESELSRLNSQPETPVMVSNTLAEAIENALEMEKLSSGLVSPFLLQAVVANGYDSSFEIISNRSDWHADLNASIVDLDSQQITFDKDLNLIILPTGRGLDLGGSAKGWAADQAMMRLSKFGPALVNAGGDVAFSSGGDHDYSWNIKIHDPFKKNEDLGKLIVNDGGVATSGRDYRRWRRDGVESHHIIDPRTSMPAQTDVLAATVVAPSAAEAEMAAKSALILGSREGLEWLEECERYAGFLVLENGEILASSRFKQFQET